MEKLLDMRLENEISQEIFKNRKQSLTSDIAETQENIGSFEVEELNEMDKIKEIVELSQLTVKKYLTLDSYKKRKAVKIIRSNFIYEDNTLVLGLTQPFAIIEDTKKKALLEGGLKYDVLCEHPIWWRWRESNPRPKISQKLNLHA